MLGVKTVPFDSVSQQRIRDMAQHFGTENTFARTARAVFVGEPARPSEIRSAAAKAPSAQVVHVRLLRRRQECY